jgi:RNA polymerase sigma-70 factor (ECF subfamily)
MGGAADEAGLSRRVEMSERRVEDDFVLLEAWRGGDRDAGAELFERHYPSIARFFHNKVPESAQDDLLQETFHRALENAARFRGQARFRTFLFGIAHNVLADYLRKLSRRMARLDSQADFDEVPSESLGLSPVATVVQHQEQRLLLEALRRIPLIHQIALELFYWEELTAEQIGEVLRVPLGTAKTRLRDGREHLEEQLRELARSPEVLQSTLDNLRQWAQRMRTRVNPAPVGAF